MNIALRRPMTLDEFLAWDDRQERKHEFDGRYAIAQAGGTAAHADIQANLIAVLRTRLKGRPCKAFGSELRVAARGRVRYPDAFVICAPVPPGATIAHDPVILFEIVSPSTAQIDRLDKLADYQSIPSARRYVILEQDRAAATVFWRDGDRWPALPLTGIEDVLDLAEIGIVVALAELYEGVSFPPPPDPD